MQEEKLLDTHIRLALDIGMRMLTCGAQISRVEDSIERICTAFGAVETHVFSVTSGIIVTAFDTEGQSATQLRRVRSEKFDLTRLEHLNQLSRDICAGRITADEVPDTLARIDASRSYPLWALILAYAGISATLSVFFGANGWDAAAAAITGVVLCLLERLLHTLRMDRVFTTFLLSLLAGLCNVALVKVGLGAHYDAISIGNIMLLIPGIAMTNAIHDMFVGDMLSGVSRFFQSLVIAVIVTFGFTLAGMLL
ncbi:MAG: threonine/serine exporter family protein [Clostridia bacterium]|nr:threonine/serine exporter family protein [Clostridia bacterium]